MTKHDAQTITFVPREGQNIKLKYFVEKVATSSAFIQVAKTTLIPDNTVQFIKGKVKGLSKSNLLQKEFFFEGELLNEDIEIPDLQLGIDNRNLRMPIINHSGKDIFLKNRQKLGEIRELDIVDEINAKEILPFQFSDVEIHSTNQDKAFSESDISKTDKHLDKIRDLISAYRNRIAEIPISVPADVPIELILAWEYTTQSLKLTFSNHLQNSTNSKTLVNALKVR